MTGLRLVIPRPLAEAETLAARLKILGHHPIVSPLLTVRPTETPLPDLVPFQAVLVTSPNGARALAAATRDRSKKLMAVGEATASHLRDAGFTDITSADGDGKDLAARVIRDLKPEDGPLLHVGGVDRAVDFADLLPDFKVDVAALYEAVAADALPEDLERALRRDAVDGIILTSPRIAAVFVRLIRDQKLTKSTAKLSAYCLSPAVSSAAALPFSKKRVAERPDLESLLTLLGEPKTVAESTAPNPTPKPSDPSAVARKPDEKPQVLAAPTQTRSGGFIPGLIGGVIGAGLVTVLLAGTVSTWQPYVLPEAPPVASQDMSADRRLSALEAQVAALNSAPAAAAPTGDGAAQDRLATLEREISALKARPTETPAAPPVDLGPLRDRMDAIDQRLRGAADAGAVTALLARLEEVNRKADAAEAAAGGQMKDLAQRGNLALATAQIAVAARDGRSFAEPVQVLKRLVGTDADFAEPLAVLAPIAGNLPTFAALRDSFPAIARAVKTAELVDQDNGWWAEVERLAGRLLTIRRTDQPATDSLDDRLSRVEKLLDTGNLVEIPPLLTGLPAPVDAAVAPWRDKVASRVAADAAVARLTELALTRSGKE
jgi:uroporphyrinogen-III synthase